MEGEEGIGVGIGAFGDGGVRVALGQEWGGRRWRGRREDGGVGWFITGRGGGGTAGGARRGIGMVGGGAGDGLGEDLEEYGLCGFSQGPGTDWLPQPSPQGCGCGERSERHGGGMLKVFKYLDF
ncbi:hypothetical protein Tco_0456341 [Tanacetum coccineum]